MNSTATAVRIGQGTANDAAVYAADGGAQIGRMWRVPSTGRYRAYRYGRGATVGDYPSAVQAAAAVGWSIVLDLSDVYARTARGAGSVRLAAPGMVVTVESADWDNGDDEGNDRTRARVSLTVTAAGPAVPAAANLDELTARAAIIGAAMGASHAFPVVDGSVILLFPIPAPTFEQAPPAAVSLTKWHHTPRARAAHRTAEEYRRTRRAIAAHRSTGAVSLTHAAREARALGAALAAVCVTHTGAECTECDRTRGWLTSRGWTADDIRTGVRLAGTDWELWAELLTVAPRA